MFAVPIPPAYRGSPRKLHTKIFAREGKRRVFLNKSKNRSSRWSLLLHSVHSA